MSWTGGAPTQARLPECGGVAPVLGAPVRQAGPRLHGCAYGKGVAARRARGRAAAPAARRDARAAAARATAQAQHGGRRAAAQAPGCVHRLRLVGFLLVGLLRAVRRSQPAPPQRSVRCIGAGEERGAPPRRRARLREGRAELERPAGCGQRVCCRRACQPVASR